LKKSELHKSIAEEVELKKADIQRVLEYLNKHIYSALKKEKKCKLDGLGIFAVKDRKARQARNPKTGEVVQVPAKTVVKFRVGEDLKAAVL
jgi:DNA-binding protein HU-beta